MELTTNTIETPRLCLRPFRMEDAGDVFRNYASDPEVTKYLTWPTYTDLETAEVRMAYLQAEYDRGGAPEWAIELKELGQVIGGISVVRADDVVSAVEIGYCIGRPWWHGGITSEAFSAVIDHLFSETAVQRICAAHDPRNPHSGAVMRKCGMVYEGTFRRCAANNQGICDLSWYAILKSDWEAGRTP